MTESLHTSKPGSAILLADDEDSIRSLVAIVLKRAGYQVIEAKSGREALDIWTKRSDEIGLLYTDLAMPEIPGQELAAKLRQTRPDLKVVFTSGSGTSLVADLAASREKGLFVAKPCSAAALLQAVRESFDEPAN